ncbi:MAG TPA: tRNA-dihydrouridine synthase family protein [Desulfobacterales bacterium]|nr:tRNA-dihydrouridine synthase family protein [Desulfobacterales bacterium]HIP39233.1 tRNA-dihydrouridine synthase family protein [Desulfocapsa sulfexigens]
MTEQAKLILAPIRGITDCFFRTLFQQYFPGFDSSLAPFINPQRHSSFQPKQLKDLLPEHNRLMPVVPQLLHTNAEDFLFLASRLHELGYKEVNWNLGCPAPMVTKKHRGSGLLPFPEQIIAFLDHVLPRLPMAMSIKTRLGYEDKNELLTLLPRLDSYPLTEIIIHPRLGRQLYRGKTDREAFGICLAASEHSIVYNGDITTVSEFRELQEQFPKISKWMIGRGALANPFLAGEIKKSDISEKHHTLLSFHNELYTCYRELLSGQAHLLGRMKQLWIYLSAFLPPEKKTWKKIKKCRTEEKYQQVVADIFKT